MGWEAWFTVGVIIFCFGSLASNRFAPDVVLLGGLTLLLLSGILSPETALSGLANEGMVTVGVLYIVVAGVRDTGGIDWIVQSVLGRPRSLTQAQTRLMAPVAAVSAFLNNTPVVALYIPAVQDWAKRHNLAVSKLMIPLSYAAIAGGTCTLIGTSTNLVVNGLLIEETGTSGLGLFDIAWVGIPVVALVLVYVTFFSKWLLPERRTVMSQFEDPREFTVEMLVKPESLLVGKTIEEAGLRQLPGMYVVEIEREGRIIPAVSPHERLWGSDRLIFAGVVESAIDLQHIRGLSPAADQVFQLHTPRMERCFSEAVVSNSCPLVGKTIRDGKFRTAYNAAIIGLARSGRRINKKIGDIVLRPGDTLLLESDPSFIFQQRNSRDFLLVSRLGQVPVLRQERASAAAAIVAGMVLAITMGWLGVLEGVMLAAGMMLIARCVSVGAARRAVDWQVLLVIAASFGIGRALHDTGAAKSIAEALIGLAQGNAVFSLGAVYLATAIFSGFATNNSAAVLMFPIALATAKSLGVDFLPYVITVMIAASASFATPIGYQTNLMVFGVGGYDFTDYLRLGLPLTILVGIATVLIVPFVWPF